MTADVDVPSFDDRLSLSGVTLTSLPSVLMVTRGEARIAEALGTPPSAARTFVAGDRIVAAVELYPPRLAGATSLPIVVAHIERADDRAVLQRSERPTRPAAGQRGAAVSFPIDTTSLAPGRYVLRIHVPDATDAERVVPFEIVRNPAAVPPGR